MEKNYNHGLAFTQQIVCSVFSDGTSCTSTEYFIFDIVPKNRFFIFFFLRLSGFTCTGLATETCAYVWFRKKLNKKQYCESICQFFYLRNCYCSFFCYIIVQRHWLLAYIYSLTDRYILIIIFCRTATAIHTPTCISNLSSWSKWEP